MIRDEKLETIKHGHHSHQSNSLHSSPVSFHKTSNVKEQPKRPRGQFKKFAIKVVEWIRKSLALGRNEVLFLLF